MQSKSIQTKPDGSYSEIQTKPNQMGLTLKFKPNQNRWVSLKLLWKVSPPVNRRLNLGFTGFSSKQTISPLRQYLSSVAVSFTTDLQKHFTHWRQHGVPWDEGEVGAGGAHPRPRQHAGCHHDAHAGQGDGGKRIEQSKKIALPMPYL